MNQRNFSVAVYGATPCGIAAATVAARAGLRVLLIEPTRHVGGLSTSGINTAESEHMLKWTIGGFADEFYQRLGDFYGTGKSEYYFESSVAEKIYLDLLREAGVELHFGARVETATKDGARVSQITLSDGAQIEAQIWIDASYEGDLMARAGVSFRVGRESKAEFGEEAAGIRFDATPRRARTVDENGVLLPGISAWAHDLTEGDAHPAPMNYNFRLTVARDPALQVPIPAPPHYESQRYALLRGWFLDQSKSGQAVQLSDVLDFYARRNGKFEINNKQAAFISLGHLGGQFTWPNASYGERERLFQDHLDYTLGLLHFLAHDEAVPAHVRAEMQSLGLHKHEFADNNHLPPQLYIREARRMRGAFIVTQHDVQENRRKTDSIGISSHFIDCHHIQRVALSPTEFAGEGRIWRKGYAYQIPYRAVTPQKSEATNLLVPCAASFSHVAFCTLRLESVWMITGHAAGFAAIQAISRGCDVQEIEIPELQAKLRGQNQVVDFLPGAPEKCEELNGPPEF